MARRKFRRHQKRIRLPKNIIFPVKREKLTKESDKLINHNFSLSETERIRYVYSLNKQNRITNIVSVVYDLLIKEEWVTVIYYDSEHGSLHRHETISFEDRSDIVTEENVKKKGTKKMLLTWAIKDIQTRYIYYKKLFLKRSNLNIDNLS